MDDDPSLLPELARREAELRARLNALEGGGSGTDWIWDQANREALRASPDELHETVYASRDLGREILAALNEHPGTPLSRVEAASLVQFADHPDLRVRVALASLVNRCAPADLAAAAGLLPALRRSAADWRIRWSLQHRTLFAAAEAQLSVAQGDDLPRPGRTRSADSLPRPGRRG
jgi:hypothetical protein